MIKSIFKAIARQMGFFMTSDEKKQKDKFFEKMQEKEEPIPCPMHEDYDDVDYRQADHMDEIAEINRKNK
jgi:hypothetical protein